LRIELLGYCKWATFL